MSNDGVVDQSPERRNLAGSVNRQGERYRANPDYRSAVAPLARRVATLTGCDFETGVRVAVEQHAALRGDPRLAELAGLRAIRHGPGADDHAPAANAGVDKAYPARGERDGMRLSPQMSWLLILLGIASVLLVIGMTLQLLSSV